MIFADLRYCGGNFICLGTEGVLRVSFGSFVSFHWPLSVIVSQAIVKCFEVHNFSIFNHLGFGFSLNIRSVSF